MGAFSFVWGHVHGLQGFVDPPGGRSDGLGMLVWLIVIVSDLDVLRASGGPVEADVPVQVDVDAGAWPAMPEQLIRIRNREAADIDMCVQARACSGIG